ncbi:MAG: TIGR03790 family protein [Limnothrix sp.]
MLLRRFEFWVYALIGLILVLLLGYQWVLVEEIDSYDPRFTAENLAVIINESDELSVQIGEYYQQQRQIPDRNMVRVSFAPGKEKLEVAEFQTIERQVKRQVSAQVQGFALTWAAPYRVDCMSITSAFAFGFDSKYCAQRCDATAPNAYFNRSSSRPYQDFQVRPTMMLAATNFTQAKQLIDRGVAADSTNPLGTGYLVSTTDSARNVRARTFGLAQQFLRSRFKIEIIQANTLKDREDVMFYFTGQVRVENLETLNFQPGAIADHLTSFGGKLTAETGQMSSLRWLEAGATGSYGSALEPCNFLEKFTDVGAVMEAYLDGFTLLESYWQSVLWPGQGVFIGEPLARPFSAVSQQSAP